MSHLLTCISCRLYQSSSGEVNGGRFYQYTKAHYFIFTTASTVGYGDISAVSLIGSRTNTFDYFFNLFIIVSSLSFYALIQQKIRSSFEDMNGFHSLIEKENEELEEWIAVRNMANKGIPLSLEKRLKTNLQFKMEEDAGNMVEIGGFLEKLGFKDKETILESVSHFHVSRFRFFRDYLEPENRSAVARLLSPVL